MPDPAASGGVPGSNCYNPGMEKRHFLVLLITCLLSAAGHAAMGTELYRALVPIEDHSDKERNRALRQGLLQVLVKLSGSREIGNRPAVKDLLANAGAYVLEFGYAQLPDGRGQALDTRYSQVELDRFLRDNQLPVWPARRPSLLVWIVQGPLDGARRFANRDEDPALYAELERVFGERGQPVVYPLHDLEDQLALTVEDGWGLDAEKLGAASKRYGADSWLLLRCYEAASGQWRVAWMFSAERDESAYLDNLDGEQLDRIVARVGDAVVDRIASAHSYVPSQTPGRLDLEIGRASCRERVVVAGGGGWGEGGGGGGGGGISEFGSYTALMELLAGLSMVRSVEVERLVGDEIQLNLAVDGDQKQLFDSLALFRQIVLPAEPPMRGEILAVSWGAGN